MSDIDVNIAEEYEEEINRVIRSQVENNKEAIFFIYKDGRTSSIYQGEATHISLSKDQEAHILSQGEIIGSVHSHPSGFNPSTIDIMTGLTTSQKYMSVVTPLYNEEVDGEFVLTTMDLSDLSLGQRLRMIKAMRRSSTGLTEFGRELRKEINLKRFDIAGYRTHEITVEGVSVPLVERPSILNLDIGEEKVVSSADGMYQYIEK